LETVAVAIALPFVFLVFMLEDIIKAWHNGKANIEAQKALGKQAETNTAVHKERAAEHNARAEELKLERAKLQYDNQQA
jgi:hypothetical protein